MTSGYGRGYYGADQLAHTSSPVPPRGSVWIKLGVILGAGAVVWYLWPRGPKNIPETEQGSAEEKSPVQAPSPSLEGLALHQGARLRGYPSQAAYEDAVVASARDLQDAGAQVAFAPHL